MPLADDFLATIKRPAIMFEVELDDRTIRFWTHHKPVPVDGHEYQPLSGLDTGLSIREAIGLSGLDTTVTISGLEDEFLAIARNEDYHGRPVVIWLANRTIEGGVSARDVIFEGPLANMPIEIAPGGDTITLEIGSAAIALEDGSGLTYSPADQALFNPADTAFDFLEDAQARKVPWG